MSQKWIRKSKIRHPQKPMLLKIPKTSYSTDFGNQESYLRVPSKRVAMVSRKVFCGASSPFLAGIFVFVFHVKPNKYKSVTAWSCASSLIQIRVKNPQFHRNNHVKSICVNDNTWIPLIKSLKSDQLTHYREARPINVVSNKTSVVFDSWEKFFNTERQPDPGTVCLHIVFTSCWSCIVITYVVYQ